MAGERFALKSNRDARGYAVSFKNTDLIRYMRQVGSAMAQRSRGYPVRKR